MTRFSFSFVSWSPFRPQPTAWAFNSEGCPLNTGLYKLNGGSGRRHAGPHTPAGPTTHPEEHTKIKVSPLTGLQMGKKYVFRNPRDAI